MFASPNGSRRPFTSSGTPFSDAIEPAQYRRCCIEPAPQIRRLGRLVREGAAGYWVEPASSHLLDNKASGWKRTGSSASGRSRQSHACQSERFRTIDLPVVDGRNVRAGFGRQESEDVSGTVGHRTPEAGEAKPLLAGLGELPFRFRRFRAGELEEVRGRHKTAPFGEAPTFRRKLMMGAPLGRAGGKSQRSCANSMPSSPVG